MENLIYDFFKSWENEIASYQDAMICLEDQKEALIEWNIKRFQKISQQTAISINRAHKATNVRNDLMETLFVLKNVDLAQNNLKTVHSIFEEAEYSEKASVLFISFINTLQAIDRLSSENKELIKTGLDIVGDNLEMIADLTERDRVYSRVGMIPQRRNAILLNTRV